MNSTPKECEIKKVQDLALLDSIDHVEQLYSSLEQKKAKILAKLYYQSVDQQGFCFDLDDIYPLIGYSRKDKAKNRLLHKKLRLIDGQDYKILVPRVGGQKKHGGHTKEKIMLTSRAFSQLALNADTENAIALRDFLQYLMIHFKDLMIKLNNGTLKLVEGDVEPTSREDTRVQRRIMACETQKKLTGILKDFGFKNGFMYARINGKTNFAVTGRTKTQIVKELNDRGVKRRRHTKDRNGRKIVPKKQNTLKNTNVRNVMGCDHLGTTKMVENASAVKLASLENPTFDEVIEVHNHIAENALGPSLKEFLHNQPMEANLLSSSKANKIKEQNKIQDANGRKELEDSKHCFFKKKKCVEVVEVD